MCDSYLTTKVCVPIVHKKTSKLSICFWGVNLKKKTKKMRHLYRHTMYLHCISQVIQQKGYLTIIGMPKAMKEPKSTQNRKNFVKCLRQKPQFSQPCIQAHNFLRYTTKSHVYSFLTKAKHLSKITTILICSIINRHKTITNIQLYPFAVTYKGPKSL